MVVLNDDGLPDFQALQNAFEIGRSMDIVYYLFDVPFLNGEDLREAPVEERRAALKKLLGKQKQACCVSPKPSPPAIATSSKAPVCCPSKG